MTPSQRIDAWADDTLAGVERYYNVRMEEDRSIRVQMTDFSYSRNPRQREVFGDGDTLDEAIVDGLENWKEKTGEDVPN